jgi:hypothetical protein
MAAYPTRYGVVQYSPTPSGARYISRTQCRESDPPFEKRHTKLTAQDPVIKAFRKAEKVYGRLLAEKNGWVWKKRSRAILITGSWRDYDYQEDLYRSDPHRFAPAYVSGHVQGIAIDVHMTANADLELVFKALTIAGFRRVRSDEPWHWSLGKVV